ncbi:MAG: hypothetical protein IT239_07265 [Bacteroidia bacterium]|nr:hypothetical protein [Bacteroidia bacterium]
MRLLIIFFLLPFAVRAWVENPNGSIRSKGMAGAGICLADAYSLCNNQAGMAKANSLFAATSFDSRFIGSGISNKLITVGAPIKNNGVLGVQINSFGTKNYSENKFGLAYAKSFGKRIDIGLQLNYLSTVIGDIYGKKGMLAAELGIVTKLTNELSIGAHIFNPTKSSISKKYSERIPVILKMGFLYQFNQKLFLTGDVGKSTTSVKPFICAGIEYRIINDFYLRTGVSTYPMQNSFGAGYSFGSFKADIYAGFNTRIGYSSGVALNYNLAQKPIVIKPASVE